MAGRRQACRGVESFKLMWHRWESTADEAKKRSSLVSSWEVTTDGVVYHTACHPERDVRRLWKRVVLKSTFEELSPPFTYPMLSMAPRILCHYHPSGCW
jgi:hypothetical protein